MRVEDGGENGKTFNSAATDITAIIPKASATGVPPPFIFTEYAGRNFPIQCNLL